MTRLGCEIGLFALVMGGACGRRTERHQHGRPQGPRSGLRSCQQPGRQGGARLQLHRHRRNPDGRHSPVHIAAVRRTAAAGVARRLHHRRQFGCSSRTVRHDLGRGLSGARALSRSAALHQHLQGGCRGDRLRQLDIGIRFERRQVLLRQRHDQRQKAGFRRGAGDLQGYRRRARSVRPRLWPTGRNARRRQVREFPPVSDRAQRHADRRA